MCCTDQQKVKLSPERYWQAPGSKISSRGWMLGNPFLTGTANPTVQWYEPFPWFSTFGEQSHQKLEKDSVHKPQNSISKKREPPLLYFLTELKTCKIFKLTSCSEVSNDVANSAYALLFTSISSLASCSTVLVSSLYCLTGQRIICCSELAFQLCDPPFIVSANHWVKSVWPISSWEFCYQQSLFSSFLLQMPDVFGLFAQCTKASRLMILNLFPINNNLLFVWLSL